MSTPTTTPIPSAAETIEVEAPKPAGKRTRLIRTVASAAVAIAIAVVGITHDGSKDALKDFAKDVKDEPGITTVKNVEMPGYSGALDINGGAAIVRAKKEGSDIVLSYQVMDGPDAERVDAAIEHAAKESGFKNQS